ncbi:hypothetical protein BH23CHL5_BH23CHL5_12930 [soil metagenome]
MRSYLNMVRVLVSTLLAVALLPALSSGAGAQGSDVEAFQSAFAAVQSSSPQAGPLAGTLPMDQTTATSDAAGVALTDVVATVGFVVPNVPAATVWNVSVSVRNVDGNGMQFILTSVGKWVYIGSGVANGEGVVIPPAGSLLTLQVVASGPTAYFGVSGEYVATVDLAVPSAAGDVLIDASLVSGLPPVSGTIDYANFTVWQLAAGGVVPSATQAPSEAADETRFNELILAAASQPVVFGPESQLLEHSSSSVAFLASNSSVTNFAASLKCLAPPPGANEGWDCGFGFRDVRTSGAYYLVGYFSNGNWFLSSGIDDILQQGEGLPIVTAPGDSITLNLIVVDGVGYIGVNGAFVATLDVSTKPGPGEVAVASGFISATTIDGGGINFEDFTVWSLDNLGESTTSVIPEPTSEPGITGGLLGGVEGNTYVSPTYGFQLTWDAAIWSVTTDESETGRDYLALSNDAGVFVDLIGEPFADPAASCFDFVASTYLQGAAYSNVRTTEDPVSVVPGVWDTTGIILMTYTDTSSGSAVELVNYVSCSVLPQQNAVVSLEQAVGLASFAPQIGAMDSLRQGFQMPTGQNQTTTAGTNPEAPGPSNGYTSPTFGYSLTWDDAWTIEEETTGPSGDLLSLSNGPVLSQLLGEVVTAGYADTCFDWLVDYYVNNPDYTSVQGVPDQTSMVPGVWDQTGLMGMALVATSDGSPRPLINYVSCSFVPGQNAVVSLEQFIEPADAVTQIPNMDALRAGFSID